MDLGIIISDHSIQLPHQQVFPVVSIFDLVKIGQNFIGCFDPHLLLCFCV